MTIAITLTFTVLIANYRSPGPEPAAVAIAPLAARQSEKA